MAQEAIGEKISMWRPDPGILPPGAWFGVPTRRGGVSRGPFASLNLGLAVGDDRDDVLRNRDRLFRALGTPGVAPLRVHQVHGTRIVTPAEAPLDADGFLIEAGDPWTAISVADCAPVALFAANGAHAALLHSGWRGTRDGIAPSAVRMLAARGAAASTLVASIGPCIHACCYPVGPEVAREFPSEVRKPHPDGTALDLPGAIRLGLLEAGVPDASIHAAPECTSCEAALFYSHRRDRGFTGRHWALARLVPFPSIREARPQ